MTLKKKMPHPQFSGDINSQVKSYHKFITNQWEDKVKDLKVKLA